MIFGGIRYRGRSLSLSLHSSRDSSIMGSSNYLFAFRGSHEWAVLRPAYSLAA